MATHLCLSPDGGKLHVRWGGGGRKRGRKATAPVRYPIASRSGRARFGSPPGGRLDINYDLGIAAALTAPGAELPRLRRDFEAVNDIFGGLIDRVGDALARIWPSLRLLDFVGGRTDEKTINFSRCPAPRHIGW
jgi:hypothetical protein